MTRRISVETLSPEAILRVLFPSGPPPGDWRVVVRVRREGGRVTLRLDGPGKREGWR